MELLQQSRKTFLAKKLKDVYKRQVSDHVTYGIVYLNHDIPQLIVEKFYDAQFIAVAKIFGYDPETQTCIASDAVFQIDNPSQMKLSPSETYGWFTLLQDHKGLVYTENNRSTHEMCIRDRSYNE